MAVNYHIYLSKCAASEKTSIDCVSATNLADGDYFTVYKVTGYNTDGSIIEAGYYVWYDEDDLWSDPAPGGGLIGIEVDIASGDSAAVVAVKTAEALGQAGGWSYSIATAAITLYHTKPGDVTNASENVTNAGFSASKVSDGSVVALSSGPEQGNEGIDWFKFVCEDYQYGWKYVNPKKKLTGHESFSIRIGKFIQNVSLGKCLFLALENTTPKSEYFNDFTKFVADHGSDSANFKVYFFAYNTMGGTDYVKFMDNYFIKRDYLQCTIDAGRFKYNQRKMSMVGNVEIDEVWD